MLPTKWLKLFIVMEENINLKLCENKILNSKYLGELKITKHKTK